MAFAAADAGEPAVMQSALGCEPFGKSPDGRLASLFTLQSAKLRVQITDYGGRIVSIRAPDRSGEPGEVLLGFEDVARYASAGGAFGALLGRTANRIAGGAFTLDGRTFQLPTNDRGANLHGGPVGFDKVYWEVAEAVAAPVPTLTLAYTSPDGDQGFPGALAVRAVYRLEEWCLWLSFEAHTTKPTLVSLSAHPYFHLAGPGSGSALEHTITLPAESFLPTDARQIPTGEVRHVAGTPFDFRQPTPLAARIQRADEQLLFGQGYDHYFVLAMSPERAPRLAARAIERTTGRVLEILTTQPGLQLYSGNHLDGSVAGRGGAYRQSAGIAFEPQGFPDAPHHRSFPTTVLRPGENYRQCIGYRFGIAP